MAREEHINCRLSVPSLARGLHSSRISQMQARRGHHRCICQRQVSE